MQTPLAGAWLFFHLAGCACLLYNDEPAQEKTVLWGLTLAWLIAVGACTFIYNPVANGAAYMWMLVAMPSLALCMKPAFLPSYIAAFFGVIFLFAVGLLGQMLLNVHYTAFNYGGIIGHSAMAWPMIDPNNAALVVNIGLIGAFYLALRRPDWWLAVGILAAALITTGSKGGAIAATVCCFGLLVEYFRLQWSTLALGAGLLAIMAMALPDETWDPLYHSLLTRIPIWLATLQLILIDPGNGIGLGQFAHYYQQIRTETATGGYYAHNDILQFAAEMGVYAALLFCALMAGVAFYTCKRNVAATAIIAAALLQSLVEFQFYLPSVSLLVGLALAYHLLHPQRSAYAQSFDPLHD